MGIELGRSQVRVPEHLLHAAEVCAPFEQMGGERMAQDVGVDALGVQPRLFRQLPQDQEGAGPRQRPSLGIEEELGTVAAVEVGPAARSYRRSASTPSRPSGTIRSLSPLPMQRTSRLSRSMLPRSSPTASLTRSPAP